MSYLMMKPWQHLCDQKGEECLLKYLSVNLIKDVKDLQSLQSCSTLCDCSHEIKRCLLLGRKVMTNLDGILKSRDITLSTKVHLVKAMVFPMVMY